MEKEGDDMKITQVRVVAAFGAVLASGFVVVWVPVVHADTGYTITVNGQNIAQGGAADTRCERGDANHPTFLTFDVGPTADNPGGGHAETQGNQVNVVEMYQNNTNSWISGSQATSYPGTTATFTATGNNTYTITGTAAQQNPPGSTLLPFEFDVTCVPSSPS
jgi:hypothetical protein